MDETSQRPRFRACSGETWRDPFPMYAALRQDDPVHHVESGDHWVLSRFADVFDAARDPATFSSAEGLSTTYGEREKLGIDDIAPMVMLDPPDHTVFRRLVSGGFTPRRVAPLEPEIRAFVRARVHRLHDEPASDVVDVLFKPLPSFVVAHFLGVPGTDRDRFDAWSQAIVAANAAGDATEAADAVGDLFGYFTALLARRADEPGDDALSALVAAADESGVTELQMLGFAFTMVTGGNDTTTGLLGGAAELLTARPDQRHKLIGDPSLLPGAVEELLRLTTPVQGLARTLTRDVEIDGTTIPAGRRVLLLYGSANRDEREFGDDAGELDVERHIARLVTFGYGAHHCLGAAAARLQARVALEELLGTCPDFTVDAAAGTFAPGGFVRRYETLPFTPTGLA